MKKATQLKVLMVIAETNRSDIHNRTPQNGYQRSTFDAVLSDCSFPDLESLYLANFTADGQVIIDFLERHPKLENLVIDGFLLRSGSWLLIAVYLRDRRDRNQRLTNVTLNNLFYGLPLLFWSPGIHRWVCCPLLMPFVSYGTNSQLRHSQIAMVIGSNILLAMVAMEILMGRIPSRFRNLVASLRNLRIVYLLPTILFLKTCLIFTKDGSFDGSPGKRHVPMKKQAKADETYAVPDNQWKT